MSKNDSVEIKNIIKEELNEHLETAKKKAS